MPAPQERFPNRRVGETQIGRNTFAKQCRIADERARRETALQPKHVEQRHRRDAPQMTVEALMFSRRDDISALGRPATLHRLSDVSDAQLREVAVRVQKFKPEIAQPWTAQGVEVLIGVRSRLHG